MQQLICWIKEGHMSGIINIILGAVILFLVVVAFLC